MSIKIEQLVEGQEKEISISPPVELIGRYLFPKKHRDEQVTDDACHPFIIQNSAANPQTYNIRTSYFIGVDWICTNHTQAIFVAPKLNTEGKINSEEDSEPNKIKETNFLQMLVDAMKHPEVSQHTKELFEIKFDQPLITIDQKQDLLTPFIVVQYLSTLRQIVKKGLKKSYYKVERNLNSRVKGKIMVSATIKRNLVKNRILSTVCTYQEFGVNGLENRLLKKVLMFIRRIPRFNIERLDTFISESYNYIAPAFEGISDELDLREIQHYKKNPFYKEYADAIRLGKLILKKFGYNISNSTRERVQTPPFWIDMSKLFELYVYGKLLDVYNTGLKYQFKASYGNPDFVLTGNEGPMVIDAKYRLAYSSNRYEIDDIRQISAYARDTKVIDACRPSDQDRKQIISCLIIYPDQSEGQCDFLSTVLKNISQFEEFYTFGLKLPTVK